MRSPDPGEGDGSTTSARPRRTRSLLFSLGIAALFLLPSASAVPALAIAAGGSGVSVVGHGTSGASDRLSGFTFPLQPSAPTEGHALGAPASELPSDTVMPGALRTAYGVNALLNATPGPTSDAVNETIAVVAWGNGYDPTDLDTFFADYYPSEFPRPKVIPVPIDGAPPPGIGASEDPSGGSLELTLDIEWSASMAPGATIYAVYAPPGTQGPTYAPSDAQLLDAVNWTVALGNLTVLSMSFGELQGADPTVQSEMDTDFQELGAEGTTVLAASGDDGGSADSPPGRSCANGPALDFPAASPYVLAVGGTNATNATGPETAWDLSGGGPSQLASDPAPSWQLVGSVAGYVAQVNEREVPDVAASAVANGLFFAGALQAADGTSFASPIWAGIVADLAASDGTRFAALDPSLYALGALQESGAAPGSGLDGVTSGSSCYYTAVPGWNPVTGWGTPSALELARRLDGATFVALSPSLSPATDVAPGNTVTVTVPPLSPTAPHALVGAALVVSVLSPVNDSSALHVYGTLPGAGGSAWQGGFVLPDALTEEWINVTVEAHNGSVWAVGTAVLTEPGPPPAAGPSLLDILVEYQLPVLIAFLLLLLAIRLWGDRRRRELGGPAPQTLASHPVASDAEPGAKPGPSPSPGTPRAAPGQAEMVPFCWKCGATLKGNEKVCSSCGAKF